jgi:hypothetical protein
MSTKDITDANNSKQKEEGKISRYSKQFLVIAAQTTAKILPGVHILHYASNEIVHKRHCHLIRPFCITIIHHNLLLFVDIFHI